MQLTRSSGTSIAARKGDGLTARGLCAESRRLSETAGICVRPHALRHAAITSLLELNGGDVRAPQRFAGHAFPATTLICDDEGRDLAVEASRTLAAAV